MVRRSGVALVLAAVLAGVVTAPPAGASRAVWSRSGTVELPTVGFPIVFGMQNACNPGSPLQGLGGYSIEIPKEVRGRPYTLTSSLANDHDIVWLRGPRGTSCVAIGYDGSSQATVQKGTVPTATTWAFVVLNVGAHAPFTLDVAVSAKRGRK